MSKKLRIGIYFAGSFPTRDLLFTSIWDEMAKRSEVDFIILNSKENVKAMVEERQVPNIKGSVYPEKTNRTGISQFSQKAARKIFPFIGEETLLRWLDKNYIFDSLMFRFAASNILSHYSIRKSRSEEVKKIAQNLSDYYLGEAAGFPLPRSRGVLNLLYKTHNHWLGGPTPSEIKSAENLNLDSILFWRVHLPEVSRLIRIFKQLNVTPIGNVGSWDHPTTKGPLPQGIQYYFASNKRVKDELVELHQLDPSQISVSGKVQLDIYKNREIILSRDEFLTQLGIPKENKVLMMGTNVKGLKEHEPSIARFLSKQIKEGKLGKTTLLLRPHPVDFTAEDDFISLHSPPHVVCQKAYSFVIGSRNEKEEGRRDQIFLANLMYHSDVVIQSRGSLAVDAAAFNTPVLSLAFDGDLVRSKTDSFAREYEFEHYKQIVTSEGTWMAGGYDSLMEGIKHYLVNPSLHQDGRAKIIQEQLDPLDGKAGYRVIDQTITWTKKGSKNRSNDSRKASEPTGLGNKNWSKEQGINLYDYLR